MTEPATDQDEPMPDPSKIPCLHDDVETIDESASVCRVCGRTGTWTKRETKRGVTWTRTWEYRS